MEDDFYNNLLELGAAILIWVFVSGVIAAVIGLTLGLIFGPIPSFWVILGIFILAGYLGFRVTVRIIES
ncbi:MAG: hypothetical protein GJU72_07925 [Acidithiobacillus ferriphilus]|jgi:Na+/H+-dicarboxylate symporter|uniref:hypothetical protein n=1 Tax=Acidithiobacillus ferriphilus TaxID=1689834 RepID=UPI00242BA06C|nr:hypothetical protein [Acidithiobacillus ferriphilus]MBW9248984.1 hypothetical protein [Acidithiobacillus ferriphilus]MBW9255954.1 hypothetical protein [Acidithiobacillus ferriphilus]